MDNEKVIWNISNTSDFIAPDFIKEAMEKKYGQGIFVIGVSSQELYISEWNVLSHMSIETTRPVEVGHSVVDIECKSLIHLVPMKDCLTGIKIQNLKKKH